MSQGVTQAFVVGIAAVFGLALPVLGVLMLARSLAAGDRTVKNYRGRHVFLGLGVVWVFWAAGEICYGLIAGALPWTAASMSPGIIADTLLLPAALLAFVTFVFGLMDDALGSGDERGFSGHLRALFAGRLTTGMIKMVGISLASLVAAFWAVSNIQPALAAVAATGGPIAIVGLPLLAGAAVALTSNFVNLTDVRPGRALKVYTLLGLVGAVLAAASPVFVGPTGGQPPTMDRLVVFAVLILFVLGPVVAVWRYDLGERGMLGDAGANAAGAVAGFLILLGMQWIWLLAAYTVLMLVLNLLSERVSFSAIVEGNGALRWLDGLGRLPDHGRSEKPTKTRPQTHTRDG